VSEGTFYCSHCGEPRKLKWGYAPSDPRYAIVICRESKDGTLSEYPGLADRDAALELAAQHNAKKAATKAARDEAKRRRIEERRKERERRSAQA
jgi:hypothetical protein